MELKNEKMKSYEFLKDMYQDGYFPNFLVDKGKKILVDLCLEIESKAPKIDDELFVLTHAATELFNDLQEEFEENDSELETGARESIGEDFYTILKAYGYEVDVEDAIATRDW